MKSDKLRPNKKKGENPFKFSEKKPDKKPAEKKHGPMNDLKNSIDQLNENIALMAKNNINHPVKTGVSYKVVRDSNGLIESFTVMG